MEKLKASLVALSLMSLAFGCGVPDEEGGLIGDTPKVDDVGERRSSALTSADIAMRWAPVHYQDVDDFGGYPFDYIARFNYDGDWVGTNNFNNAGTLANLKPAAYYRVAETATHWFLSYVYMHPRDWDYGGAMALDSNEHENDMEGVVAFVRKDGSPYGKFEGFLTVAHTGWYQYRNNATAAYLKAGRAVNFNDGLIGPVLFQPSLTDGADHPMTWAQPQGHGLYGCNNPINCGFPSNGGVIRYQPTFADVPAPTASPMGTILNVGYTLLDMVGPDQLWAHRFDRNALSSWGKFKGDDDSACGHVTPGIATCTADAAGTPWGTALGGSDYNMFWLFTDPAHVVSEYFGGWDNSDPLKAFSLDYTTDNAIGAAHSWTSQPWRPADPLGATDKAVAAATFENSIYLWSKAAGSGAQTMKVSKFNGATWRSALPVPGTPTSDSPAAATECNGKLYTVIKPSTGAQVLKIASKAWTGDPSSGWSGWSNVTGATSSTSAALACRGKLYVYFRGTNGRVYLQSTATSSNNVWSAPVELPGGIVTNVAPAAVFNPSTSEIHVVAVNSADDKPNINTNCGSCADTSWSGWTPHTWTQTSTPVSLVADDANGLVYGSVHMFTQRKGNQRIEEDTWTSWSSSWRGQASVRGHHYSWTSPAAASLGGAVYLFATGVNPANTNANDNTIWYTTSRSPGLLLSAGKPTVQSSTYNQSGPERAVDSRTDSGSNTFFDGHMNGVYTSGFVTHTNQDSFPFWYVNLGAKKTINQIDIFNRIDSCCMSRLQEWSVWIWDDVKGQWTKIYNDSRTGGAGRLTTINAGWSPAYAGANTAGTLVSGPWQSQYVLVQINRTEWLHLAEVQVWGN